MFLVNPNKLLGGVFQASEAGIEFKARRPNPAEVPHRRGGAPVSGASLLPHSQDSELAIEDASRLFWEADMQSVRFRFRQAFARFAKDALVDMVCGFVGRGLGVCLFGWLWRFPRVGAARV